MHLWNTGSANWENAGPKAWRKRKGCSTIHESLKEMFKKRQESENILTSQAHMTI